MDSSKVRRTSQAQAQAGRTEAENATLKTSQRGATAQSTQLAEQVQRMAAERQQERFTALIATTARAGLARHRST
jgi:hypothetical protein